MEIFLRPRNSGDRLRWIHTTLSAQNLSIQAGVNPKQLQGALGHSDIQVTMDLYTLLYEADRDGHAARLSKAAESVFSEKYSQNVRNQGPRNPDSPSRLGDSNSGPTHYECVALPPEEESYEGIQEQEGSRPDS